MKDKRVLYNALDAIADAVEAGDHAGFVRARTRVLGAGGSMVQVNAAYRWGVDRRVKGGGLFSNPGFAADE